MRRGVLSIVVTVALVVPSLVVLAASPASASVFSNPASIALNEPNSQNNGNNNATASPYPSTIAVSGLSGTVSSVSVTLNNVSYSHSQDIDALLVGPGGQTLIVVANLGPNGGPTAPANNSTLTLSDAGSLPSMLTPWGSSSSFKPVNFGGFNEVWEAPAPSGPYGNPGPDTTIGTAGASFASAFGGTNPNGTWSLYVITTAGGDGTGAIAGGWSLNVSTANAVSTTTTLASTNNPSFTSSPGNAVTLTASVTSTSTVSEGSVAFTDGGVTISGCGAVAVSGGQATCNTTFTTEGVHSLAATYSGTANFGSSHSAALSQVANNHTTVNGSNFCNTGSITLKDPNTQSNGNNNATATPYPSNVFVSGLSGAVNHVGVTLNNVSYSHSQDIDVLLVGPGGQNLILVANVGPTSGPAAAASNATVTFSDAGSLPGSGIATPWSALSTVKPVNYGGFNEVWEPPAPAAPHGDPGTTGSGATLASVFNGIAANGTWSLYVITTAGGDGTGAIAGGWCATITAAAVTATTTALASNNNPSFTTSPGSSVALTATVSSTSTISEGSLAFTDNGVTILGCGAVAVSAGQAVCNTSFGTEGSHPLQAQYSGTANFGPSSATVTQVVNNHTTVNGSRFCNTGGIALNNPPNTVADATPYPSNIFVSNKGTNLLHLSVTLNNVSYGHSQDIDALLVGPSGQSFILVSAAGATSGPSAPVSNVTLTLDDNAASTLASNLAWGAPGSSVTSKPVNYGGVNQTWRPPAPAGPYGNPGPAGGGSATLGATFDGASPNGTWSLYVITTASGDGTGAIAGGWCLNVRATPVMTTTASASVPAGGTISDTATLSEALGATGTITFTAFGPNDATCSATPVLTSTKAVSGNGAYTSDAFTALQVGTYRFKAAYSGDANNGPVAAACNDPNESVVVTTATPTLVTAASSSVALGGTISDTGTLSGGGNPSGTLIFTLFGPNDATCTGTPVLTSAKTVAGNGSYTSDNFTTTTAGTYRFAAVYSGDVNNAGATSGCGTTNESVVVTVSTPTIVTQASTPVTVGATISDTATLSAGASPTGTITFTVFGPDDTTCANTPVFTSMVSVTTGDGAYPSGTFATTAAGTYRFVAAYSGDTSNAAVTTMCNDPNESLVVAPAAPQLVTAASASVPVAGTISDTATLSGGVSPTGTITFDLFGPNNATCTGTPIFTSTKMVSDNGDYLSGSFTTTAPGTYSFEASYSGDANNAAVGLSACGATGENTTVTKATPVIATTASSSIVVGGTISDAATLSGAVSPTGTITFDLFDPTDATCTGTPIFTSTKTVSGNGSYPSGAFTTSAVGTYRFVAAYAGDANNATATTACSDINESVVVSAATPALGTQASTSVAVGGTLADTATVSGAVNPTGTITFTLFGPNNATCLGLPIFTSTKSVSGNGNYTSDSFTSNAVGTYQFVAVYSGDTNNSGVTSPCNTANESAVVTAYSPTIVTQASAPVTVGGTIADTATLSGAVNPTGTITFTVFGPNDATCATTPAFTSTKSVNANGNYGSDPFTVTLAGTYRFIATYGGDANNTTATTACNDANEAVAVGKTTPGIVTVASGSVAAGQAISDTATLSGGVAPAGTIAFTLFGPDNATCAGTATFTSTVTVSAGNGSYPSAPFTTAVPATYRWVAAYGGDANNVAVTTACNDTNESVTVTAPFAGYTPVVPLRICDTRAAGPGVVANQCDTHGHLPLPAGGTMTLTVAGVSGVPANATAVVLHVAVTGTSAASFLTLWPTGQARPNATNLNWTPGQTVGNLVQVEVGPGGRVSVFSFNGSADVIVDLEGYVSPNTGGLFVSRAPVRVCDTRAGQPANQCNHGGTAAGTLGPNQTQVVNVETGFGVPAGATAVVLNVTATMTSAAGYLTVWPVGAAQPLASSLNWAAGQTISNRVITGVGPTGNIEVFNAAGTTDVVIDLGGYFTTTASGSSYVPISPIRICDTRPVGPGVAANLCNRPGAGALGPGQTLALSGVKPPVTALVLNVTVTNTGAIGLLFVFPGDAAGPSAPDVIWSLHQTIPNLVVASVGSTGTLKFFNASAASTDVVIDLEGYYTTGLPPAAALARPAASPYQPSTVTRR